MRIKLADGTEVEVADDSQVAIAARELDRVKALGYDSVEAYQKAMDDKVDKLEKHNRDNDDFINRQKTELGALRKEVDVLKGKGDEPPKKVPDVNEPDPAKDREAKFQEENIAIESALTDEERAHADAEYIKHHNEASPEIRALLKTEEGKREFFKMVFPDKTETVSAPVSLFRRKEEKSLSVSEQIRNALEKDDRGRSRRPIIPTATGSGFVPKGDAVEPVSKVPISIHARSGGILDAAKAIENQGVK